jgi:hypothetical protein
MAEDFSNSVQRSSMGGSQKYDRRQQPQHSQLQQQHHHRNAPRYNSNPTGGRRSDGSNLTGGGNGGNMGRGPRSSSSSNANIDNRRRNDHSSFDGSSTGSFGRSNGSYRNFNDNSSNGSNNNNNNNNNNNGNNRRRYPTSSSSTSGSSMQMSSSTSQFASEPSLVTASSQYPKAPKIPFCFDVEEKDILICEQTAETMRNLYSRVYFDEDILSKISELALNAHNFLQLQQQNLTEFYDDKRQHDIEVWLSSCSEEEQKRYWERQQQS